MANKKTSKNKAEMSEGKFDGGNVMFAIVIVAVILIALFVFFVMKGAFNNPKLVFEAPLKNLSVIDNGTYYDYKGIELIEDENYGKAFYFHGEDYLKTRQRVNISVEKGFSVSFFAFVEDNSLRNNLGMVSTSAQNEEIGFRTKFRAFENEDRFYIQMANDTIYGEMPKDYCYMTWCHYAFTYTPNGEIIIYINGEKLGEFKSKPGIALNYKINIGNTIDINREFFEGKIADVRIYEGVLPDSDVRDIVKPFIKN